MIITAPEATVTAACVTGLAYGWLGFKQKRYGDTTIDSNERLGRIESHITDLSEALREHTTDDARNFATILGGTRRRRRGLLGLALTVVKLFLR